jgi:hypothetical protein
MPARPATGWHPREQSADANRFASQSHSAIQIAEDVLKSIQKKLRTIR